MHNLDETQEAKTLRIQIEDLGNKIWSLENDLQTARLELAEAIGARDVLIDVLKTALMAR